MGRLGSIREIGKYSERSPEGCRTPSIWRRIANPESPAERWLASNAARSDADTGRTQAKRSTRGSCSAKAPADQAKRPERTASAPAQQRARTRVSATARRSRSSIVWACPPSVRPDVVPRLSLRQCEAAKAAARLTSAPNTSTCTADRRRAVPRGFTRRKPADASSAVNPQVVNASSARSIRGSMQRGPNEPTTGRSTAKSTKNTKECNASLRHQGAHTG